MSDFKGLMKGGWHPKGKDGGKESWRGDFKGINQVAGWVGKGKKPGDNSASEHVSRPLSTLKDPASFGPPPKNVNYHGGAALPNEITPHRGGIGAPLTQEQIESANRAVNVQQAEPETEPVKAGPPLPYRANTTGLRTEHLPPPPVRRGQPVEEDPQAAKPKPGLPPRLPSRQNTNEIMAPPPPSYEAVAAQPPPPAVTPTPTLNQSAMNRLGKAGVNVPAFGIGRTNSSDATSNNPWKNEQSQAQASTGGGTLSELQSRFSRMNSSDKTQQAQTESPAATPPPPTMQQTSSAFNTAQNFRRDPSSVSMNDAKNAASTVNSGARSASAFRDKHQGSIAAAEQRANAFNNKYQIQSRFERFLDKHAPLEGEEAQQQAQQAGQAGQAGQLSQAPTPQVQSPPPIQGPPQPQWPGQQQPQQQLHAPSPPVQSPSPELAASISRKPPPPPPPKKPTGMHGNAVGAPPPPVPLGTKPSYS